MANFQHRLHPTIFSPSNDSTFVNCRRQCIKVGPVTGPSRSQLAAAAVIESALAELLFPRPFFNRSNGLFEELVSAIIRLKYAASLLFCESFASTTGSRDRLRSPDRREDPEASLPTRTEAAGETRCAALAGEFDGPAAWVLGSSGSLSDRLPRRSKLLRRSIVSGGSKSVLSLRGDGGFDSGLGTDRPDWRVNLWANAFRRFRLRKC